MGHKRTNAVFAKASSGYPWDPETDQPVDLFGHPDQATSFGQDPASAAIRRNHYSDLVRRARDPTYQQRREGEVTHRRVHYRRFSTVAKRETEVRKISSARENARRRAKALTALHTSDKMAPIPEKEWHAAIEKAPFKFPAKRAKSTSPNKEKSKTRSGLTVNASKSIVSAAHPGSVSRTSTAAASSLSRTVTNSLTAASPVCSSSPRSQARSASVLHAESLRELRRRRLEYFKFLFKWNRAPTPGCRWLRSPTAIRLELLRKEKKQKRLFKFSPYMLLTLRHRRQKYHEAMDAARRSYRVLYSPTPVLPSSPSLTRANSPPSKNIMKPEAAVEMAAKRLRDHIAHIEAELAGLKKNNKPKASSATSSPGPASNSALKNGMPVIVGNLSLKIGYYFNLERAKGFKYWSALDPRYPDFTQGSSVGFWNLSLNTRCQFNFKLAKGLPTRHAKNTDVCSGSVYSFASGCDSNFRCSLFNLEQFHLFCTDSSDDSSFGQCAGSANSSQSAATVWWWSSVYLRSWFLERDPGNDPLAVCLSAPFGRYTRTSAISSPITEANLVNATSGPPENNSIAESWPGSGPLERPARPDRTKFERLALDADSYSDIFAILPGNKPVGWSSSSISVSILPFGSRFKPPARPVRENVDRATADFEAADKEGNNWQFKPATSPDSGNNGRHPKLDASSDSRYRWYAVVVNTRTRADASERASNRSSSHDCRSQSGQPVYRDFRPGHRNFPGFVTVIGPSWYPFEHGVDIDHDPARLFSYDTSSESPYYHINPARGRQARDSANPVEIRPPHVRSAKCLKLKKDLYDYDDGNMKADLETVGAEVDEGTWHGRK
ncbi:hypothetical protein B0T22DRAFT_440269 [Podospora appendiculata]|uniref:Uncharacterized protein n=1 Tax=Podospora appendiculata TaxID=314037 RepID=A0AAE1CCP5_9PEZI|nr:hypothetical protein B0T22DRAFT_440269 [Podospora appendiculata]